MKRRSALWALAGFLVGSGWVLYSFVAPPDRPVLQDLVVVSCPVVFALRSAPLAFWWVPMINAATYAVIGLLVEVLRRRSSPRAI